MRHPDCVLREEDFVYIRTNWDPKSENVKAIADGLNVLPESLVFVDDNPAEREIVTTQVPGVCAPPLTAPEQYIRLLDRSAFFEATVVSEDDAKRAEMYRENAERQKMEETFTDYAAYLESLEMHATIEAFQPLLFERISQLTNKSNQFNLTTKRFTVDEIAQTAQDETRITLYGRLSDKFGDNGVVSLVIARVEESSAHIELWLMSCRVLKRDMEYAMMDTLVDACRARGVKTIYGYYDPTAKTRMVEDFYALQGFTKIRTGEKNVDGRANTVWEFAIPEAYEKKNTVIEVA